MQDTNIYVVNDVVFLSEKIRLVLQDINKRYDSRIVPLYHKTN